MEDTEEDLNLIFAALEFTEKGNTKEDQANNLPQRSRRRVKEEAEGK
jgi:hypothetical protein